MTASVPVKFSSLRPGATSSTAINSTAAASTAVIGTGVYHVRATVVSGDGFIKVAATGEAASSTADMLMLANTSIVLDVLPGQRISGITASTGASTVLSVTEAT
jgi:hypothetical protein